MPKHSRNKRLRDFLAGKITVEDLDEEELSRGQCRDKNGNFTGRPWSQVPIGMYKAMAQEYQRRLDQKLLEESGSALETLVEIHKNRRLPADARMKSAIYVYERFAGKVPEKQEMAITVQKWEEDIEELFTYDGTDDAEDKRKGKGSTSG